MVCDGITQKALADVNAASAVDGLITSCLAGFTISSDKVMCFKCQPGYFFTQSSCQECSGEILCDGSGNSSICPKGAVCLDGLVLRCSNLSEFLNAYKTKCVPT